MSVDRRKREHRSTKTLIVVRVNTEKSEELQIFFRNINGFSKCYCTSRGNPHEILEVYFNRKLRQPEDILLRRGISRRNAKIVDDFPEKELRKHENKIKLRNSFIYFCVTYFSSLTGMITVSPTIGADVDVIQSVLLSLIPAVASFFTRLKLELKI